jgi:hypothetical protein
MQVTLEEIERDMLDFPTPAMVTRSIMLSKIPCIRNMCAYTAVFLIISSYKDENGVICVYARLHTRRQLFPDGRIPTGYFHKPETGLNFHVLKMEHRNNDTLMRMRWL